LDEEKYKNKPGKKAEPTSEELECIYECFAKKLPNGEVLEELESEDFALRRSPAFIKRRRREFEIAKKVIAKNNEGAYDKDRTERYKKHNERLSERALELIDNLKSDWPYSSDTSETITEIAVENDDYDRIDLLESFLTKCLFSHMKAELPQLQYLTKWNDLQIKSINTELLDRLTLRVERGDFQGKCEVCKDWD